MFAEADDLHSQAMHVLRDVAAAPPTSRLGRMRSRARDLAKTRFVEVVPEEDLLDLSPANLPRAPAAPAGARGGPAPCPPAPAPPLPVTQAFDNPFGETDPDDTHKPDYAD
jgi:hypothetical protein